jgi:hypothetical protein
MNSITFTVELLAIRTIKLLRFSIYIRVKPQVFRAKLGNITACFVHKWLYVNTQSHKCNLEYKLYYDPLLREQDNC